MTAREKLNKRRFLKIPVELLSILTTNEALFLCDLINKDEYTKKQNPEYDGWFYKKRKYIELDIKMIERTQQRIEVRLKEKNILQIQNTPQRTFYCINYDQILCYIDEIDTDKLSPCHPDKTSPLYYNNKININTNEINNKLLLVNNNYSVSEETTNKLFLTKHEYNTYIPLFRKWKFFKNLSNIKIPDSINDSCTKTLKETCKLLHQILNGEFFKNNISNDTYEEKAFTLFDIEKAIEHLNLAFEPGYYADKKDALPRSFKEFLLTYKTRFSWFIFFLNSPKILKSEKNTDTIPFKNTVRTKYLALYESLTHEQCVSITNMLKRQYDEYLKIKKNIGLVYNRWSKWDMYFSNFDLFTDMHILYLKRFYKDGLTIGHLNSKMDSKVWIRFVNFVKDEYQIILYPSNTVKDKLKRKRWKYLGESGKYTVDDFENYYLIKEDLPLIKKGDYIE